MQASVPTPERQAQTDMMLNSAKRSFSIRYAAELNLVTVRGWSTVADADEKYVRLQLFIENHLRTHAGLKIYFRYDLFDTAALKYIFNIIRQFNVAHKRGKLVTIYWSATSAINESEILETGVDLMALCDFNFEISDI